MKHKVVTLVALLAMAPMVYANTTWSSSLPIAYVQLSDRGNHHTVFVRVSSYESVNGCSDGWVAIRVVEGDSSNTLYSGVMTAFTAGFDLSYKRTGQCHDGYDEADGLQIRWP